MGCETSINEDLNTLRAMVSINLKGIEQKIGETRSAIEALAQRVKDLEVEKKGLCGPVRGEKYFYIDSVGVVNEHTYINHPYDIHRLNTGNYFRTKEEAERHMQNIEVEIKLRALIKKINAEPKAPQVFPDWSSEDQRKYSITLPFDSNIAVCDIYHRHKNMSTWEYCYRDFIKDAIEAIGNAELIQYYRTR